MLEQLKLFFTGKNFMVNTLALAWSLFAMFYIWYVTVTPVPADSIRIVDTIIGFLLGTIVATIVNFFFGSSKGSSDKNEIIKQKTA